MKLNKPHKFIHGEYSTPLKTCVCQRREDNPIHTLNKNTRDNRINKEGFDAGYIKGYKKGFKDGWRNAILPIPQSNSLLNSFEGHSGKGEA